MICKKCGANIADTSKFCGYCGNPVEQTDSVNNTTTNQALTTPVSTSPVEQTQKVPDVNNVTSIPNSASVQSTSAIPSSNNNVQSNLNNMANTQNNLGSISTQGNLNNTNVNAQNNLNNTTNTQNNLGSASTQSDLNNTNVNAQNNLNTTNTQNNLGSASTQSNLNSTITNPQSSMNSNIQNNMNNNGIYNNSNLNTNQNPTTLQSGQQNLGPDPNISNDKKNKKGVSKGLLIVLVVVIAVLAIIFAFTMFGNKSTSNITPASVVAKSLGNFQTLAKNSVTMKASMSIENNSGDTTDFDGVIEYAKVGNDSNFSITLNKSSLYDEMNLYSIIDRNTVNLYVNSRFIDLFEDTKSDEDIWVFSSTPIEDTKIGEGFSDIDLSSIVDEQHVTFVDKNGNIRHYAITLDKSLLEKNKDKLTEEQYDYCLSFFEENNSYIVDIYINDLDELVKMSAEISELDQESEISKVVIMLEFSNLNSTSFDIPEEALSGMGIEEYISNYAINDEQTENQDQNTDDNVN